MTDQMTYRRRSARVLVLDEADRLLLLKSHVDPEDPAAGHAWATPGGGVEAGESLAQAAARELREETGLVVAPEALGPAIAYTSGYADLGWAEGVFRDDFFHLRVARHTVDISGQGADERTYHAGHRWWAPGELAGSGETVYPLGLAGLLGELVAGRVPGAPVRLPWHH